MTNIDDQDVGPSQPSPGADHFHLPSDEASPRARPSAAPWSSYGAAQSSASSYATTAKPMHLGTGSGQLGLWLMVGSGISTLLTFVALPVLTVPVVGSFTAPNLASLAHAVGLGGVRIISWMVPVAGLALIGAGFVAWRSSTESALAAAAGSLIIATIALWTYALGGTALQAIVSNIPESAVFGVTASITLSAGFWLVLLALAAGMGGAIVQLEACSRVRRHHGR